MAFFKKLKDKLFKSSSKIDEGLEAIVSDGGAEEAAVDEVMQEAPAAAEILPEAVDPEPAPAEPVAEVAEPMPEPAPAPVTPDPEPIEAKLRQYRSGSKPNRCAPP